MPAWAPHCLERGQNRVTVHGSLVGVLLHPLKLCCVVACAVPYTPGA